MLTRTLCLSAAALASQLAAQTPKPPPPPVNSRSVRLLRFSDNKPVLGLPSLGSSPRANCAGGGDIFVDIYADPTVPTAAWPYAKLLPDLYRITPTGEAAHLLRASPPDESSVSNGIHTDTRQLDFYVAERTLVTLLQSSTFSERDERAPDYHYFVSTSDLDGGSAKLTPLDLRFHPLKIALFGSGDYLVLGWDPFNLQPLLALVKDDGTVRRFLELGSAEKSAATFEPSASLHEAQTSARATAALAALQHAAFVSYGSQVMLTYPGTTRPIEFLTAGGEDRSLAITYPGGYVLQQVFVTRESYPIVLRAAPIPPEKPAPKAEPLPPQRLLEYSAFHPGAPIREFLTTRPTPEQIACAPPNKLTAIFLDTLPGASKPTDGTDPPQVLVIGSSPR